MRHAAALVGLCLIGSCCGSRREGDLDLGLGHAVPEIDLGLPAAPMCPRYGTRVIGGEGVLTGPCTLGSLPRSCYSGPPETQGIGACHAGVQVCNEIPVDLGAPPPGEDMSVGLIFDLGYASSPDLGLSGETRDLAQPTDLSIPPDLAVSPDLAEAPDGGEVRLGEWGPCMGERTPVRKPAVDVNDDNCDGRAESIERSCLPGETPRVTILRQPRACFSAITPGGRWSLLAMSLGCTGNDICDVNETTVLVDNNTRCLPPPPPCAPSEALDVGGTPLAWRCVPCTYLVEFGFLFDGERHCTGAAPPECPPGQVPWFDDTSLQWMCAPPCDNGRYDLHTVNGEPVCVPC